MTVGAVPYQPGASGRCSRPLAAASDVSSPDFYPMTQRYIPAHAGR